MEKAAAEFKVPAKQADGDTAMTAARAKSPGTSNCSPISAAQ
jgi:hypothetical protein